MSKIFRKTRKLLIKDGLTPDYIKYAVGEIFLVVVGILIAFSINAWNAARKDEHVENRILTEISNGLEQDMQDVKHNKTGHKWGLDACRFFSRSLEGKEISKDSTSFYWHYLLRDFTSIQNTSGYESLKSKGLELVQNDSLRTNIIVLYEQLAPSQRKLEESYEECQFFANYFDETNRILSSHLIFDEAGDLVDMNNLANLPQSDKAVLQSILWRIKRNRLFVIKNYEILEEALTKLHSALIQDLSH